MYDVLTCDGPTPARAPTLDELKTADQLHGLAHSFLAYRTLVAACLLARRMRQSVLVDEIGVPNVGAQLEELRRIPVHL